MKNRLIITSEIDNPLHYVQIVIDKGLISGSGKCYCYATVFESGVVVTCKPIKSGFSFCVWNNKCQ